MNSSYPFDIPEPIKTSLESAYVDHDHQPPWRRYGRGSSATSHQPHHIQCLRDWSHSLNQCYEALRTQVLEMDNAISSAHVPEAGKVRFRGILSELDTTADYLGRLIEDVTGLLHWSSATWEHDPVLHAPTENKILDVSVWVEEYLARYNVGDSATLGP